MTSTSPTQTPQRYGLPLREHIARVGELLYEREPLRAGSP
jgi:hypothetical protein